MLKFTSVTFAARNRTYTMHLTRISTSVVFTLLLLGFCALPVRNQCRSGRDTVLRIRPITPRLPITTVTDFRVQAFRSQPLLLLDARVARKQKDQGVYLTVKNVGSQSISYFEYGISSCAGPERHSEILLENQRTRTLRTQRKALYRMPSDEELEAIVNAASLASCKHS